jgi:hypothetical protein
MPVSRPNCPLPASGHPPHPQTKRLAPAATNEVATIHLIVRRRPGGPPVKDLDYFQRVPIRSRKLPSRDEFQEAHGSTQQDLDAVAHFCRDHHLEVLETNRSRRRVVARGTVAQLNTAFGVELYRYESPFGPYRGFTGSVQLPPELNGIVQAVNGLDNRPIPSRHLGDADPAPITTLTPGQVAQLYNFPAGTGIGQTIGLFEQVGINEGSQQSGYQPTDVTDTLLEWGVAAPAPTDFPPGSNPGTTNYTEPTMDITIATAVAPKASIVVYFCPGVPLPAVSDIIDTLHSMIHPLAAGPFPTIICICWAWAADDETSYISSQQYTQISQLFQDAANLGITVLSGSGDTGAFFDNPSQAQTVYPGSDPYVLSCGGTSVGNINFDGLGGFEEYVWNDTPTNFPNDPGATGGGISALFPVPPYQTLIALPPRNTTGTTGRGIPDVAGNASPNSGYLITFGGAELTSGVGGTSIVAPLYAGLVALINENLQENVGFLNPTLYALAPAIFRDVTGAAGPTNNSFNGVTGYTAGIGWDPCTGWGSINGAALLSILQGITQPGMTFVMDRTTFGQNEVAATGGVFSQAFFVVVDGLRPSDFPGTGITATSSSLSPPSPAQLSQWAPTIPSPLLPSGTPTNLVFTPTAVASEGPTLSQEIQRFTFTYQVTFPDQSVFAGSSSFPMVLTLSASLNAGGGLNATAQIELIEAGDPFFSSESNGGLSWLSDDIRVFNAIEGSTLFGAPPLGNTPTAALNFINWITSNLSGPLGTGPNGETFENTLAAGELASALSLNATTIPEDNPDQALQIYNFAIARVRLNGTTEAASKVRVFFRLFQGQATTTPYQAPGSGAGVSSPTGPYRQWSDGMTDGQKCPLLGVSADGTEYITVPCFATTRVTNSTAAMNMTTQSDPPNVRSIPPIAGSTVYAYFGCWLDTNQSQALFPYQPGANPDGPFAGSLHTLGQVLVRGGHQCLVVEIVDDEAPIINDATPGTSDKIAQRNLAFTTVANPGQPLSRLATHTFEIRPSPITLTADQRPDELMIDWGALPEDSIGSIYLPTVAAREVLALAARMYATHNLTAWDSHTLLCRAGGTSYVPIPKGSGANLAGLFSVELPPGIKKGQEFSVIVRQVTSVMGPTIEVKGRPPAPLKDRYVYGAFQVSIPVSIKEDMRVPEEQALSVMRWIQESIPLGNRWHPVFLRYVDLLAGKVDALGSKASAVPPTQTGVWPGLYGRQRRQLAVTGKIDGVAYDYFGDFEAFLLVTREGHRHRFENREARVHALVQRVWAQRILTTVIATREHPERPFEIILHAPPSGEE